MDIKEGDTFTRMLAGTIPMKLKVVKVTDTIITGQATERSPLVDRVFPNSELPCWTFLRATGAEIDLELNWDGISRTGSYIDPDSVNR